MSIKAKTARLLWLIVFVYWGSIKRRFVILVCHIGIIYFGVNLAGWGLAQFEIMDRELDWAEKQLRKLGRCSR